MPVPTIDWFFGPNNASLPSGVTLIATVMDSGNTYSSTLQFSPLQQSHAGMYKCRLGSNARLAVSTMITSKKCLLGELALHNNNNNIDSLLLYFLYKTSIKNNCLKLKNEVGMAD